MDATDRIVSEFDRLVAMGRAGVALRPLTERSVYYIVATRCLIDIDGFTSVYEQDLATDELLILIDGLDRIGEPQLALEFRRGYDLLRAEGFYQHLDWHRISQTAKDEIETIGRIVDDKLWDLDDKLVRLLDAAAETNTT